MFEPKKFRRGLHKDEEPFPVIPKVGPYIVSFYFDSFIGNKYRLRIQYLELRIIIGAVAECQRLSHFVIALIKELN